MERTKTRRRRDNVITRDEYDAKHGRPIRRTYTADQEAAHDRVIARRAQRNPAVLRDWLTRVEGRFMGVPTDVTPEDALMQAIRITAGEVEYCNQQIARLSEDELFERPNKTVYAEMPNGGWEMVEERRDAEVISRWQQLRSSAMDRMTRYAKMALDVGIEERQTAIHERQAMVIARFFETVMDEIGLTDDQLQTLGPTMRRHLALIEGTATDVP
jgi:hypothetical protein